MLTWVTGQRDLQCRVCGEHGIGDLVAEITAFDVVGLEAVRCRVCGSIDLADEPQDFSPDDRSLDVYIEAGAGIGTIASTLSDLGHGGVKRFLDVGCNYPFSLDLARFLYGWDVLGVEPSPAGRRGARELGVDIREEFLTPQTDIGGEFQLVLASEVIEHVTDPLGFLQTIRAHLASDGALVMTTPAAEIVSPDETTNDALLALSPGFHVYLASVKGMLLLLEHAGFRSVQVERVGGSLHIAARVAPDLQLATGGGNPVGPDELERYYAWRGKHAAHGSALALGLATRLVRLRCARGDFDGVRRELPWLFRTVKARHGFDLKSPRSALRAINRMAQLPWSVTGSAFALGMYHLLGSGNARKAVQYFELSELVAERCLAQSHIVDGDTVDLLFQAPYHRLLALAQFDPARAAEDALRLGESLADRGESGTERVTSRQCRVYVDLVSRRSYVRGSALEKTVVDAAPRLAVSLLDEPRRDGLDALYSLGVAALNTGDAQSAAHWFEDCLAAISSDPDSEHATSLARVCDELLRMARDRAASPSSNEAGAN
jgi:SAM-dependent methyltransferase